MLELGIAKGKLLKTQLGVDDGSALGFADGISLGTTDGTVNSVNDGA